MSLAIEGTVAETFQLGVAPCNQGWARRLADGTLRPMEREDLDLVRKIRAWDEEGCTRQQITVKLTELGGYGGKRTNWTHKKVQSFVTSERFRIMDRFLSERLQAKEGAVTEQEDRKEERRRWNRFGQHALAYYDSAFARHPTGTMRKVAGVEMNVEGQYIDADRAERAAKLVAEGQGWTVPEPVAAKPQTLKIGVIQAQMSAIAASDRKETVVRVTQENGETTVEVGSRDGAPA